MSSGDTPPPGQPGWHPHNGGDPNGPYGPVPQGDQYGSPGYGGPPGPFTGDRSGYAGTYGSGYGPPPNPPQRTWIWLAGGAVVVIAAIVIIALVLTSGGGTPVADGSSAPPTPTSSSDTASPTPTDDTSSGLTSSSNASSSTATSQITAPTTDVLPSNAGTSSCDKSTSPRLAAVSVVTVVGLANPSSPNSYIDAVLQDCTSSAVRSRIPELYGKMFGYHYSDDKTGGGDMGPTAEYSVAAETGSGVLDLTLTKQQDGHYEVTDYTYTP